jgi:hypothetical protein
MKLTTTFLQLTTYLKTYRKKIIKKMVSVEFNRFINYYKKLETFQINLQVLKDVRD